MASPKKTSSAKPVSRKSTSRASATRVTASRKTVARRAPAKRTARNSEPEYESFKIANDIPSFFTFKFTKQTVYWVVIVAFLIFFQLWIIKLQLEVARVVDMQQTQLQSELESK